MAAEACSVVRFDERSVTCRRPDGLVETVRWDDLRAVLVMTTSNGPAVDDVYWVLAGESSGCVVPSEAEGATSCWSGSSGCRGSTTARSSRP
jgi:hypothetical protein